MADIGIFFTVALFALAALVIFVWLDTKYSWNVKLNYHIGTYFYRRQHNRNVHKQALTRSARALQPVLSARPSPVGPMGEQEGRFFFLREVELNTGVELLLEEAGGVVVSKKHYRKLEEYFKLAASKQHASAHQAFAHHGLALRVKN